MSVTNLAFKESNAGVDAEAQRSAPYFLSTDAHVCTHGDQLVILDLTSGRYYALDLKQARSLTRHVQGWPVIGDVEEDPELLEQLIERGLLTPDRCQGKDAQPVALPIPRLCLADLSPECRPTVTFIHVWWFVIAVWTTWFSLRWIPLKRIVARVKRRKAKNQETNYFADVHVLLELMRIFSTLRPFMYSRTDACLVHAIALMEFLSHYGFYPEWVFGVQTAPFTAHSWLQHGEFSLTDAVSHLDSMKPIMVI